MHKFKFLVAVIPAIALSGCVTDEERLAQTNAQDADACLFWGVARGSQPYLQCCAMLRQQHAADEVQRREIGLQQMAIGAELLADH